MKGFSVEPGERRARVMSIQPERLRVEIVGRADLAEDLAGHGVGHAPWRPRRLAPSFCGGFARHRFERLPARSCCSVS